MVAEYFEAPEMDVSIDACVGVQLCPAVGLAQTEAGAPLAHRSRNAAEHARRAPGASAKLHLYYLAACPLSMEAERREPLFCLPVMRSLRWHCSGESTWPTEKMEVTKLANEKSKAPQRCAWRPRIPRRSRATSEPSEQRSDGLILRAEYEHQKLESERGTL